MTPRLKITYEKLGTNDNFFTFIKSLSSVRNPMELYSNLSNYIPKKKIKILFILYS